MSVLDSSLQKCLPGTHKDWGNYFIFTSSFFRIMDRSEIQWYYLDPGTMYTVQRLPNNYVLYKWNNITWAKRKDMVERWLREQEGLQKTKSHLPLLCGYHMSHTYPVCPYTCWLWFWQLWPRFCPFYLYLCPWLF